MLNYSQYHIGSAIVACPIRGSEPAPRSIIQTHCPVLQQYYRYGRIAMEACKVERSISVLTILIHTCSSLDQSHSCGCLTRATCPMERSAPGLIFLVHTRSSLDQSNGSEGITAHTCSMQGHLRLQSNQVFFCDFDATLAGRLEEFSSHRSPATRSAKQADQSDPQAQKIRSSGP